MGNTKIAAVVIFGTLSLAGTRRLWAEETAGTATSAPESRRMDRKGEPFLHLSFDYRRNGDILDSRPLSLGEGTMSVTQMKFSALVSIFSARNSALGMGGAVPLRSVDTSDPSAESGSELGGFDSFLQLRFMRNFELKLNYAQRQSPKLFFYDNHPEYSASLTYTHHTALIGNVGLMANLGPDVAYAVGSQIQSESVQYGPEVGAHGQIAFDLFFNRDAHFRLGTEAFYRRIMTYSLGGTQKGGASLATFTPAIDYHLLEEIWIGAFAEIPTNQPVGAESRFGNSELPGLYGKSFGIRLRATSL